jgi:hypothetical protein
MRKLFIFAVIWACQSAWADVQLLKLDSNDPIEPDLLADVVIKGVSATPNREPHHDIGLKVLIDDIKYYIQPSMFMAKSKPGEVCTPSGNVLAYQCQEGQRYVKGCHLLFFDAQGKWVGWHTMNIDEKKYPHYCNAMPAMGIANKAKNELLVTMQYFLADGGGSKRVSDLGSDWFRMTTMIRMKANNGKIEVEQDDSCLGNPNQVDTIAKARKQLQRCLANQK